MKSNLTEGLLRKIEREVFEEEEEREDTDCDFTLRVEAIAARLAVEEVQAGDRILEVESLIGSYLTQSREGKVLICQLAEAIYRREIAIKKRERVFRALRR